MWLPWEVSSHALDLERTWDTQFAVTAFTNLTQDHLDYHKTFESYFAAKARLFSSDYPAKRVINIDSKWGKELLKTCSAKGDAVITTGFDSSAQIHPLSIEYHSGHTDVELEVRGSTYFCSYPLVGKFNVENIMTAFGIALQLGYAPAAVIEALKDAPQFLAEFSVLTLSMMAEFLFMSTMLHTPDALAKALDSVSDLTKGRTIVVFGCGGDRDSSKRPLMGKAALAADFAVVTSDNPRTEDPQVIIANIVDGMKSGEDRFVVEADRREAIAKAISLAKAGDAILVAGKGHEDYQLVGDKVLSFDDVVVAAEELEKVFG